MHPVASQNNCLPSLPRLFTRDGYGAYDLIDFDDAEGFERPTHWSPEATALFAAEAASAAAPRRTRAVEENTVPSWLWRRAQLGDGLEREHSARQVFDRLIGAAIYKGWKLGLFAQERDAQIYYDELRYVLAQRIVVVEPARLADAGIFWAYGMEPAEKAAAADAGQKTASVDLDNATIDAVVSGRTDKAARAAWQRALALRRDGQAVTVRFTDTARERGGDPHALPGASVDLLALRHNNGSPNIAGLRHAVRLLAILLDLHAEGADDGAPPIGYFNMAPLLMGLALAYDSDEARAAAAAISGILTAEAYHMSALLAKLRGKNPAFIAQTDIVLRRLRNHCRAAYGDQADYEKTSILPQPLKLTACPDLALVAEAQRGWDRALDGARKYGLRHIRVTAFGASPQLAYFSEGQTQGAAPLSALTALKPDDGEIFRRELHPSVAEALQRLGYSRAQAQAVTDHIGGARTLAKAPGVNHAALRKAGLTAAAIGRVEDYLPYVGDVRLAVTPWIVGEDFCRDALKIPAKLYGKPDFSLLRRLGFTDRNIAAANACCYGHGSAETAPLLDPKHKRVFAVAATLGAEALIRMSAAVQSFISEDVAATLALAASAPASRIEKILLEAWRQGLKSVTLTVAADAPEPAHEQAETALRRGLRNRAAFLHTRPPQALPRRRRAAGSGKYIAAKTRPGKSAHKFER